MNTNNLVLIYDDNCLLCSWYSSLFVRAGLLHKEGRQPFSNADDVLLKRIEVERGRNEIPLIDLQSGKVHYGVEALLVILNRKIPVIKSVGELSPVNWLLKKLYKFISFNRKVIVAKKCGRGQFDCAPEFNVRYRVAFLFAFLHFNSLMLLPIHRHILTSLKAYHLTFFQLELAHGLIVFSNCMLACLLPKRAALEYLGQVNMLALCTVLLCLPLLLVPKLFPGHEFFLMIYLGILTLFIVREYFRRMNYADILSKYRFIASINMVCLVLFVTYLFI